MANDIIKKDNRLIIANYKLPVMEQRVVYTLLSSIRTDDTDFKTYKINIREMAQTFGLQASKDLYNQVYLAARELRKRELELPPNGRRKRFTSWLGYIEYEDGEGEISIRFDASLKPYLLQLKEKFTLLNLGIVAQFKSQYSFRFYEFLKEKQHLGDGGSFWVQYTLEELRTMLCLAVNEYAQTKDLRVRAIEPALKEIQKVSDLDILGIEYIKKGRAINAIRITAQPKGKEKPQPKAKKTKQAKPVRTVFAGLEKTTFEQLRAKHPTVTENEVWDLAEKHQKDVFTIMQAMLNSDSNEFELQAD